MWRGKSFADLISDKRVIRAAVIIGLSAIAILGITTFFSKSEDRSPELSKAYAEETEQRLLEIIGRIDGVGHAEIFLTMENSGENIYLKNTDKKTLSIEPRVRGIVIVCDGGDDPLVISHVMEAVTKSLCISSDKVCITK